MDWACSDYSLSFADGACTPPVSISDEDAGSFDETEGDPGAWPPPAPRKKPHRRRTAPMKMRAPRRAPRPQRAPEPRPTEEAPLGPQAPRAGAGHPCCSGAGPAELGAALRFFKLFLLLMVVVLLALVLAATRRTERALKKLLRARR